MKKQICVNQLNDAERIMREGFKDNFFPTKYELRLLSRLMRKNHGWGDEKIQKELIKICEKWYPSDYFPWPRFLDVLHAAAIDKKELFISIDNVRLTHTEIEIISHIEDHTNRKFAFGLLCMAKRTPYDLWPDDAYLVKDLMKLRLTHEETNYQLYLLGGFNDECLGLIGYKERYSKKARQEIDFIHLYYREPNETDQDVAIEVDLYGDGALNAYKSIFGEKDVYVCGNCGDSYTKSPNATKTTCCPNCAKETKKQKTAARVGRFRQNKKD